MHFYRIKRRAGRVVNAVTVNELIYEILLALNHIDRKLDQLGSKHISPSFKNT